ncbi:DUF5329 domain-containing protein [Tahibacter amnicola]|uniref:DUF5329 domain-containing protein n=1 Tax=Tahibacter amnicola TaxID=2976241 RepID=A0ABY6BDI9_9GAMM|nr:DUF5329 domain-containing protein [Tahibacter amnicola]UXI67919.1 DUF5329 domain-containing protein [Tahibacter amnicola]
MEPIRKVPRGGVMMRWQWILVAGALALAACERGHSPSVQAPLAPGDTVAAMTARQRTTSALPGSQGALLLSIDDITRGQVMASVMMRDGITIAGRRSIRPGDLMRFDHAGRHWEVRLVALQNALVGDDYAQFEVAVSTRIPPPLVVDDRARIEQLISRIEQRGDLVFIRSSKEHSGAEAAAHLRRKWKAAGAPAMDIGTFIDRIGSRSETDGTEYQVRLLDGRTVSAREFLRGEQAAMDR